MTISNDNDRLTIIIPKVLKGKLKKLADYENRSISNYVVNVLEEHISEDMKRLPIEGQLDLLKVAESKNDYKK